MNADDAEEYTQALAQVGGGWWRQIALAQRLGVPEQLGYESTRDWVEERLGHYPKIPVPERREAVAELAAEGRSQREIGDVLGVDQATVHRDLKPAPVADASASPEPDPERPVDADASPEPEQTFPEPESEIANARAESGRAPTEWDERAQRESERRAARVNLQRILTFLASPTTVPPEKLAAEYADVVHEFDQTELNFAVQTMTAIATLNGDH